MYVKSLSIILLMYIKRSKIHVETGTGSFTTQGEVFLHVQLVKRPSLTNRAAIIQDIIQDISFSSNKETTTDTSNLSGQRKVLNPKGTNVIRPSKRVNKKVVCSFASFVLGFFVLSKKFHCLSFLFLNVNV